MKVQNVKLRKYLLVFYLRENVQGMKGSYDKLLMYAIIVKDYHKTQLKKNIVVKVLRKSTK